MIPWDDAGARASIYARPMPELPAQIRVLIADDQTLVRAGFKAILDGQQGITVVGEAVDGRNAVDLAPAAPARRGADGRTGCRPWTASRATRRGLWGWRSRRRLVLVVTTFENDDYVYDALRAGADGFLLKGAPARTSWVKAGRQAGGRRGEDRSLVPPAADPARSPAAGPSPRCPASAGELTGRGRATCCAL